MRLFLAINLPDETKRELSKLAQSLKTFGQLKLVEEGNVHITLKFLGEARLDEISKNLDGILDGIPTRDFDCSIRGLGAFPTLGRARVVWVGCDQGAQEIIWLHNFIENTLDRIEKDKKFHPHATLARINALRDKEGLRLFIEKNKSREFGVFRVKSFELMSSKLSPKGPHYEVMKTFPL